MGWLFSKKLGDLEIPPVEDQLWSVAQGEHGGAPLLLRFNASAKSLAGHSKLPIKLGFAIPLNQPNEGGLPNPEENQELAAIEDLIEKRVLEVAVGIHAMTLTNGIMKELVFYIVPGVDIAGLHQELREAVRSHEVQCMAVQEPKWDSFRSMVP